MIGIKTALKGDALDQAVAVIDDQRALLRWPSIKMPQLEFDVAPKTFDKRRDVLCRVQSTGTYIFLLPYRGDFEVDVRMLVRPKAILLKGRYDEYGKTLYVMEYREPRRFVVLRFEVMFNKPNEVLDGLLGIGE